MIFNGNVIVFSKRFFKIRYFCSVLLFVFTFNIPQKIDVKRRWRMIEYLSVLK